MRNPGAILPAILMVFASLLPLFLVVLARADDHGRDARGVGEFAEEAANGRRRIPELAGLAGNA